MSWIGLEKLVAPARSLRVFQIELIDLKVNDNNKTVKIGS